MDGSTSFLISAIPVTIGFVIIMVEIMKNKVVYGGIALGAGTVISFAIAFILGG